MSPWLIRLAVGAALRRAAQRAIRGRDRSRGDPAQGRFIRADVNRMVSRAWEMVIHRAPALPRQPTPGSRMNLLLACLTLAMLEALLEQGVERAYAIELVGDAAWKIYERWGQAARFMARLGRRDAVGRMQTAANLFLRFPFNPPGYRFERLPLPDGIGFDILHCPIAEYMRANDAADLCLQTWCNLDYALAELWGGWLERSTTRVQGAERCDFRWKVSI